MVSPARTGYGRVMRRTTSISVGWLALLLGCTSAPLSPIEQSCVDNCSRSNRVCGGSVDCQALCTSDSFRRRAAACGTALSESYACLSRAPDQVLCQPPPPQGCEAESSAYLSCVASLADAMPDGG